MSILAKTLVKDMPSYLDLIQFEDVSRETPEESINRLIDKINKHTGGND